MHYATAIITIICILLQVFCLVAIAVFKIKHVVQEKKIQYSNAVRRIHPDNIVEGNSSCVVEMKSCKKIQRAAEFENREVMGLPVDNFPDTNRLNNTVYNKTLVEVYQIAFCTVGFLISFIKETKD